MNTIGTKLPKNIFVAVDSVVEYDEIAMNTA